MVESDKEISPKWLTKEYLEPLLKKYKKDNTLQIINWKVNPATEKGENYASVMIRINVDFILQNCKEQQTESYIVKTSYENDPFVSNIMSAYKVYQTEMLMYEKILPELSKLLKEIGDKDKLFADTIHVDYEHSAILFEDLAPANFVCADRLVGMDLEHTKLALKKLAKMHATAAVFNERQPNVLQKFDHGIFNRYTKGFSVFFESLIGICANFAGQCPQLGDYYKQKLLKLKEHVVEYATRVYDLQPGHFHTLNHGDFWTNNIMLQYENDEAGNKKAIRDALLIDFQFCCWTSPAVDLHYFLNTSVEAKLRFQHEAMLLQYYHKILTQTLRDLKFNGFIPTLHEFWVQMEAGRFYAVPSSLVVQPMMINDKTEDADFNGLMRDDERGRNFRTLLYTNKVLQEYVKVLLPYFDRRGLLDVTK